MNKFDFLSAVIDYPKIGYQAFVQNNLACLREKHPQAWEFIIRFNDLISQVDHSKLEEFYTITFDVKGICCLDVGYVLFGEDYKRGEFLVQIQRMQKENKVNTGTELSDHLTNMLKLLNAMPENEERKELIEKILMPALEKIMNNFDQTKNNNNFFLLPLQAIDSILKTDFQMDRTIFGGALC